MEQTVKVQEIPASIHASKHLMNMAYQQSKIDLIHIKLEINTDTKLLASLSPLLAHQERLQGVLLLSLVTISEELSLKTFPFKLPLERRLAESIRNTASRKHKKDS